MAQKIRILLVKKGNISERELARRLNTPASNLSAKLKRDNFSENDLRLIADTMGCDLEINFIDKETGEKT